MSAEGTFASQETTPEGHGTGGAGGGWKLKSPDASPGKVRPIVTVGDPVLATPCRDVTEFGAELRELIDDMFATMYAAPGVGLAANQIGVDLRIFVIDCPDTEQGSLVGHVVNPVLEPLEEERDLELDEEGCLSIPGPYTDVPRLKHVAVTGVDWSGSPVRLEGYGRAARCLQHETDHLNGYLYIDRLPAKQRRRILREYENLRSRAETVADAHD